MRAVAAGELIVAARSTAMAMRGPMTDRCAVGLPPPGVARAGAPDGDGLE